MDTVYRVVLWGASVLWIGSFLFFMATRPWRSTPGKVLATALGSIALLFILLIIGRHLDEPAKTITRLAVVSLTFISGAVVFAAILTGQILGARERNRHGERRTGVTDRRNDKH